MVLAGERLAAFKPICGLPLSLLYALAFDTLRTLGALDALMLNSLRTFGALNALAFLRPFRTLEALTLDTLRSLGTLRTFRTLEALTLDTLLALRTLRAFRTLEALTIDALRSLGPLDTLAIRALRTLSPLGLTLAATLVRLYTGVTFIASALGTYWAGQRHGGDTSNQEKLASHYNLLA